MSELPSNYNSQSRATDVAAIAGLSKLWAETQGDPRVCIAILDGPVDLTHPSLAGANLTQINTLASGVAANGPAAEHGTHVASVIFGGHDGPVRGIAPQCRGIIVPVFRDGENGAVIPCSQVDLARAITQAIDFAEKENAAALVINISGGQFSPSGEAHPLLSDVVRKCDKSKVLIVAAAGNQGCDCLHLPGAIPSVLTVGAMDLHGSPLEFSNWGEIYRAQGILAPGENILGAVPTGGTATNSGTSFATPIASGVAALLLSLQASRGMTVSAMNVQHGILHSALGCEHQQTTDCRKLLAGRLNISGAFSIINQGERKMTSPINNSMSENVVQDQESHAVTPRCTVNSMQSSTHSMDVNDNHPPHLTATESMVMPSACGCGGNGGSPTLVYALGKLSFDYGTRSRRSYFVNAFRNEKQSLTNIDSPADLIFYLTAKVPSPYTILSGERFANRTDVASLIWTLSIDDSPVYAIMPTDAFAFEIHDLLLEFLNDQVDEETRLAQINAAILDRRNAKRKSAKDEKTDAVGSPINLEVGRVAVAGVISGQIKLYTGETVPIIRPDNRGLRNWTTKALLDAAQRKAFGQGDPTTEEIEAIRDLAEFLNVAYNQTRNLGIASQDRALNYAATDAFILQGIFRDVREDSRFRDFEFDSFDVTKSPICRPDSDCWDVTLFFYDPSELRRARRGVRYTIDVSDTVPVVLGRKQDFSVR